jgi:hypothetical protein
LIGYSCSQKAAGSRPDEVNEFFSIYLILPTALVTGVYSASKRNEYQKQKNDLRNHLIGYSCSRKVARSILHEMNELFSMYLILPTALGAGVYSASNRNEYQKQKSNASGK